jgi:hypothetical protein
MNAIVRSGVSRLALAASLGAVLAPSPATATDAPGASEGVPLRLCSLIVREDRPFVIAIRTCQPRGLSQGQILIRRPAKPLPLVRRAHVFSTQNDAVTTLGTADDTSLHPMFVSPSATVNTYHGPLLAILMRPDPAIIPGEALALTIEGDLTLLLDSDGDPTTFTPLDGSITVCAADAPYVVSVGDSRAAAGRQATITVLTHEFARYRRLETTLRYDPTFFPRVLGRTVWNVRGDMTAQFSQTTPGEIRIILDSPRRSIGVLPGGLVDFLFEVSPILPLGSTTVLTLDPASTRLVDQNGVEPPLELRAGTFTVIAPETQ